MVYPIPHFIGGTLRSVPSSTKLPVYNPAFGHQIGEVDVADEQLCNRAIENANAIANEWAMTPPIKRARILFKFRELLEKDMAHLAKLVTTEHGKTLDDAKGSIARGIEIVEWHCGILGQLQGRYSNEVASGLDSHTIMQPVGLCVGVSPFNFPVMVPIWMMIPAIACGNPFILKPSEQDPSAPIRLMELLTEAGLPPGVAQCIQGNKDTVNYLITHPDVKAVTAVASSSVAHHIYKTATALGKRAHTFGGAKNHCVVMDDACLDKTAKAIIGAAYGSAGERCMAISVVVAVGQETANQLVEKLLPMIRAIKVDEGCAKEVDMGPLISQSHQERVLSFIDKGVQEGAALLVDGREFSHPDHARGFFVGPTLFDHVKPHMQIYQQEIFGPVLVMLRVDSLDEAIALINAHQYGNGTAIFTESGLNAREFSQRVQVGMVGVNVPIPVPIASHPFGGWKQSVFGDTNMHGLESIHFYTRRKTITTRWLKESSMSQSFNMPTHHQ